jgi:cation diffusion facilitator CzcD-associated flavoprotein CzcO
VLTVGAGISGVGSACHLTRQCPELRLVVLEAKPSFGGTWITHRCPGIRSDSDRLPRRGDKPEWAHTQDYWTEKDEFPAIDLDDPAFVYA